MLLANHLYEPIAARTLILLILGLVMVLSGVMAKKIGDLYLENELRVSTRLGFVARRW
jgi:hypothetical protein